MRDWYKSFFRNDTVTLYNSTYKVIIIYTIVIILKFIYELITRKIFQFRSEEHVYSPFKFSKFGLICLLLCLMILHYIIAPCDLIIFIAILCLESIASYKNRPNISFAKAIYFYFGCIACFQITPLSLLCTFNACLAILSYNINITCFYIIGSVALNTFLMMILPLKALTIKYKHNQSVITLSNKYYDKFIILQIIISAFMIHFLFINHFVKLYSIFTACVLFFLQCFYAVLCFKSNFTIKSLTNTEHFMVSFVPFYFVYFFFQYFEFHDNNSNNNDNIKIANDKGE